MMMMDPLVASLPLEIAVMILQKVAGGEIEDIYLRAERSVEFIPGDDPTKLLLTLRLVSRGWKNVVAHVPTHGKFRGIFTNADLEKMSHIFPSLRYITLRCDETFTGKSLSAFAKLGVLMLRSNAPAIDLEGLPKHLISFILDAPKLIQQTFLLPMSMRSLADLGCTCCQPTNFLPPSLTALRMRECQSISLALEMLDSASVCLAETLRELELSMITSDMAEPALQVAVKFTNLKVLQLMSPYPAFATRRPRSLAPIASLTQLESLTLPTLCVADLNALTHLPHLTFLPREHLPKVRPSNPEIIKNVLRNLTQLLEINGTDFDMAPLVLETMNLQRWGSGEDSSVDYEHLSRWNRLTEWRSAVGFDGEAEQLLLALQTSASSLKHLRLEYGIETGPPAELWRPFTVLEVLAIDRLFDNDVDFPLERPHSIWPAQMLLNVPPRNITVLELQNLTVSSLEPLSMFSVLEQLVLVACHLPHDSLRHIVHLPQLSSLSLYGTYVDCEPLAGDDVAFRTRLHSLDLRPPSVSADRDWKIYSTFPKLHTLDLDFDICMSLASFKWVLSRCHFETISARKKPSDFIEAFVEVMRSGAPISKTLRCLHFISITGSPPSEVSLRELLRCTPRVTELMLSLDDEEPEGKDIASRVLHLAKELGRTNIDVESASNLF